MARTVWLLGSLLAIGIAYILYEPSFDPESLRGARVVITGCSSGIGEQMAYEYAKLGAKVVITARRENRLQEVVAKMSELGAQQALYVAGDMGKAEDCERTIQTAKDKLGGLDILVINHLASTIDNKFFQYLWDGDMEYAEKHIQANYVSYIRLASLALPTLHKNSGSIVVVGSGAGKFPVPLNAIYAGTKFGLRGFFSSLRQELRIQKSNVSITYIVLGSIDTGLGKKAIKDRGLDTKQPMYPAAVAAQVIIRGGATRQRDVYYPWGQIWTIAKIWDIFPEVGDYFLEQSVIGSSKQYDRSPLLE
uniref:Hydroxysteroid dehydrogenase 1I n=1 Tax=Branchiostoma floridae TaxID=7739 RepID=C3YUB5_BRAFL|eukprot:XP_002600023.1 hydroxysteroid dehydrogenase 1I [Branchiostoma floridae]